MSRTGVFLQVRLDSSRLPRKALLPLAGKPVICHAMEALKGMEALKEADVDVFALLTDRDSEPELRPLASEAGFEVFVGPRDDVLERYALAAEMYGTDTFIRATGDNPLVSGSCARTLLELHRSRQADYSGYTGLPLGTGVECVRTHALMRARELTHERYDREHVCPYLYNNPDSFHIYRPQVPERYRCPQLRVTLDTGDDYSRLCGIFAELYKGRPIPTDVLVKHLRHLCSVTG